MLKLPPYITQSMNLDKSLADATKASVFNERATWDSSPTTRNGADLSLGSQKIFGHLGQLKPSPLDLSVNIVKKSIENVRTARKATDELVTSRTLSQTTRTRPTSAPAVTESETSYRSTYQSNINPYVPNFALDRKQILNADVANVATLPTVDPAPAFETDVNDATGSDLYPLKIGNTLVEMLPSSPMQMVRSMFPPRTCVLMEDFVSVRIQRLQAKRQNVRPATAGSVHSLGRLEEDSLPYIVRISDVGVEVPSSYLQPSSKYEETPTTVVSTSTGLIIDVSQEDDFEDKDDLKSEHKLFTENGVHGACRNQLFIGMKELRRLAYRCGMDKLAYQLRSMRCRDKLAGLYECIADHIDEAAEQELCDMIMRCIDIVHCDNGRSTVDINGGTQPKESVQILLLVDSK
jgi:hypothetical protein